MGNTYIAIRQQLRNSRRRAAAVTGLALIAAASSYAAVPRAISAGSRRPTGPRSPSAADNNSIELNDKQLKSIKYGPVETHSFSQQRVAVGSIDFDENLAVQVFTPYQGRIIKAYAEIGDEVRKGQTLFTIESPDLIQAESSLISAAGVYDLTTAALNRAKPLYDTQGLAQKDLEQAESDQMSADGALKAARDAVKLFGKTDAEIDAMIAQRKIDRALVVASPIDGRVTARQAQPGLLVQPGAAPAPYQVADISTMWMLANVAETDSPLFHAGQTVRVKVMAFPDHDFEGKISTIGATVDPNTHTVLVRSEVRDPRRELRPGMFATYVINTGALADGDLPCRYPEWCARVTAPCRHLGHQRPASLRPAHAQDRPACRTASTRSWTLCKPGETVVTDGAGLPQQHAQPARRRGRLGPAPMPAMPFPCALASLNILRTPANAQLTETHQC